MSAMQQGGTGEMTFEQVHAVNTARCRRWHEDSEAWTGADWATALGGECGEALNIVKKLRRVECGEEPGPDDPPVHELGQMLANECADVFLYLDLLAWHYGICLPLAIVQKFNAVSERQGFPERLPLPSLAGATPPSEVEGERMSEDCALLECDECRDLDCGCECHDEPPQSRKAMSHTRRQLRRSLREAHEQILALKDREAAAWEVAARYRKALERIATGYPRARL
jgi:NTP pyrophosphatase (non-canonical NTP hydrolase)